MAYTDNVGHTKGASVRGGSAFHFREPSLVHIMLL